MNMFPDEVALKRLDMFLLKTSIGLSCCCCFISASTYMYCSS